MDEETINKAFGKWLTKFGWTATRWDAWLAAVRWAEEQHKDAIASSLKGQAEGD